MDYMKQALSLAKLALGQVSPNPAVGAIIVRDGEVVGQGYTQPPGSWHAEMVALRQAGDKARGGVMYVTLEPCPMCAGAIVHARVQRVVIGAADPRTGAACSVFNLLDSSDLNHRVQVETGLLEQQCSAMLKDFFAKRRGRNRP